MTTRGYEMAAGRALVLARQAGLGRLALSYARRPMPPAKLRAGFRSMRSAGLREKRVLTRMALS